MGATGVMDVATGIVSAAGSVVGGGIAKLLGPLVPYLVVAGLLLAVVVFAAGKSGALKISKVGV